MSLDLTQIKHFIAIAEHGSFQETARSISVPQATLSRQMRELEAQLGAALFVRHVRGIKLSNAGRVFLDEAREILSQMRSLQDRVQRASDEKVRVLRGAYNETWSRHAVFSSMFHATCTEISDIAFKLSQMGSDSQMARLEQGLIDFALLFVHADDKGEFATPSGYESLLAGQDEFMLFLHVEHSLSSKKEIYLVDLRNESIVQSSRRAHPQLYDRIMTSSLTHGVVLNANHEADTEGTALRFVQARLGSAILPGSLPLDDFGDLQKRKIKDFSLKVQLRLVWRQDAASTPLDRFIQLTRDTIARYAA
jgi:DNA-binding transcriptional LysR family regulator